MSRLCDKESPSNLCFRQFLASVRRGSNRWTTDPLCRSRSGTRYHFVVEMVVDEPRDALGNAVHGHQIGSWRPAHRLGRAEMLQQRALARRADAGDLVERVLDHLLLAPRAVRADGEAVRLVAQALHEIEHRIARRQRERIAPGMKKRSRPASRSAPLATPMAIRP
jgi:hypothetical protein